MCVYVKTQLNLNDGMWIEIIVLRNFPITWWLPVCVNLPLHEFTHTALYKHILFSHCLTPGKQSEGDTCLMLSVGGRSKIALPALQAGNYTFIKCALGTRGMDTERD